MKDSSLFLKISAVINAFSFVPGLIMAFLHLTFSVVFLSRVGLLSAPGTINSMNQQNFILAAPLGFFGGYLLAAIISISASVLILKHSKWTHAIAAFLLLFPTCLLGIVIIIDILVIIFWHMSKLPDITDVFSMYVGFLLSIIIAFIQFCYHVYLAQLLRMKGAGWY